MSKILHCFLCLIFLGYTGVAMAATVVGGGTVVTPGGGTVVGPSATPSGSYSCPTYRKYSSCKEGYYLAYSYTGTSYNSIRYYSTPRAGNACRPCTDYDTYYNRPEGYYYCAGGTARPVLNAVTITYNLNGGSGTTPYNESCIKGQTCTLNNGATTSFYRAGYVFKGWALTSAATSGFTSYTFTAADTVYAVWEKCGLGEYKPGSGTQAAAACSSCPELTPGFEYWRVDGLLPSGVNTCFQAVIDPGDVDSQCTSTDTSIPAIVQIAASDDAWGTMTAAAVLAAKPGAYLNFQGSQVIPEGTDLDDICTECGVGTYSEGGDVTSCSACPELTPGFEYRDLTGMTSINSCMQYNYDPSVLNNKCTTANPDNVKIIIRASAETGDWALYNISPNAGDLTAAPGAYVNPDMMTNGEYLDISGFDASNLCVMCKDATFSPGGDVHLCSACPPGYDANTETGKTSAAECQISCDAGTYVATANAACTTVGSGYYKAAHMVNYGSTSTRDQCPANYRDGAAASSESGCQTSCDDGTYVKTANAACTAVGSGYYKAAHTVNYGSTSTRDQCPSGYQNSAAGAAVINDCYMNVSGGKYVARENATTAATCVAGTYKAAHTVYYGSTSSCSACTGRTKYSGAGASECSTVDSGYYSTGCNTSGNNCTGQSQCTGATYCTGGVQTNCPAQTSGWTRNGGTGWTSYTQCNQRRMASAISQYCVAGTLRQVAISATEWGETFISEDLEARAGAYVSGQTCLLCTEDNYCTGGTAAPKDCPTGYPNSDAGAAAVTSCYSNTKSRPWSGSQVNGDIPTNCSAVTEWGICSRASCEYVAYSNSTGTADGTIKSGCETNADSCIKPVQAVSAKPGFYDAGTTCTECPSGYPNSDADNEGGITQCYSNTKSRPWSGSQVNGTVPTNCSAVTEWGTCSKSACEYVAYSNSTGSADGAIKSGCETNTANCTKPVKAVLAKSGFYDAGTTCTACPSAYPNSADGNEGGMSKCYMSVSGGKYVATANATSVSTCAAGTYKAAHTVYYGSTSSCGACTGRTKYSGAGASACSTVDSGYYSTGCNTSGNNCTGQSQCTGATYCSSGVQNSCPAQTSGWTRNGGTGWTSYTQCNQTRAATSVSSYCSAGQLKQTATSATAWGASTISTAFQAKAGAYVNGQTCSQCTVDNYCTGGTAAPTDCPSGYPNSDVGAAAVTSCYSNTKSRPWSGSQVNGAIPSGCSSVPEWNSCSNPACEYVAYANSAGTADGTIKSGCSTNAANCTRTPKTVSASGDHYVSGVTCPSCPSGYPNSDGGTAGIFQCYSDEKSRPWMGGQISCKTPAGCSDSTCNICTLPACSYVAYSNSTGSADGAIKSGCATNNEDCQQTVKSVTANAGRYVSGITCPACAVGTFQGADDSTATSCSVCAANTYAASTGMSACTACPSGYSTSGDTAANHDAKSDCSITCAAGTRVVTPDAACTTPTGSWYTASHSVAAGSTTPTATVKACLTNYSTPNTTTRTDHDASTDCKISCAAGTRITAANATSCTTPAGNWYVGAHSVAQGSVSSYSNCLTNYTISGTAAANHDTASDCKISCGGGSYIANANNTTCSDVGAGYWAAASTVSQGSPGVRNACDDGLTTIGSGAGADEAGDCGRVLNVNGEKIYLRSTKKTTPSLNVGINGKTFYGNMGTATKGTLRINSGGTTYSVYDDSM